MAQSEELGINITVAYRLEKRRVMINGVEPTPEELERYEAGEEIPGLELVVVEVFQSEPEAATVTAEQLDFLKSSGFVIGEPEGSTENGSNGRGS